ncbi:MAG: lycopene cyclase domain-containing protein [Verrucomicrobiota bacterium]|nr:lycopene cyclase domain-containing protein [Verrucomicrobiota bacterium]
MTLTYYTFHLLFNVPLTLLLWWLARRYLQKEHYSWAAVVLLIVFVFTTPWDNFAVMRNIWNFPEGRYLFRIWHLPLEEYLFFAFESVNIMFFIVWMTGRDGVCDKRPSSPKKEDAI